MDFNRLREEGPGRPQKVRVEITWKSIFRVLLGVLLAYVAVVLWPIFRMLLLAMLLAVALSPIVTWVCRRGWSRWVGLSVASGTLLVLVFGCFAIIGPMVYHQAMVLGENLPKLKEQLMAHMPQQGILHNALEKGINPETVSDSQRFLEKIVEVAKSTVGGLVEFIMVVVLAIYLMADGPKAVRWLSAFFPAAERPKISQGMAEISQLVSAYAAGQFIVSSLCAVYVFAMLSVLGVPMALLLAIIAGICDILPLIGFVVAVALMTTVGFAVSPLSGVLVFCCYAPYHLFENVFILPKVYGRKLRISPIAVPLAVAAGALIAGVVGAIIALPFVAAYPVVERLWLRPNLTAGPVREHEETNV